MLQFLCNSFCFLHCCTTSIVVAALHDIFDLNVIIIIISYVAISFVHVHCQWGCKIHFSIETNTANAVPWKDLLAKYAVCSYATLSFIIGRNQETLPKICLFISGAFIAHSLSIPLLSWPFIGYCPGDASTERHYYYLFNISISKGNFTPGWILPTHRLWLPIQLTVAMVLLQLHQSALHSNNKIINYYYYHSEHLIFISWWQLQRHKPSFSALLYGKIIITIGKPLNVPVGSLSGFFTSWLLIKIV